MTDTLIQLTIGNNTRLGYIIENTIPNNENLNNTKNLNEHYFDQLPPYHIGIIIIDKNTKYHDKENYIIKDNDILFNTKFYMEKYKNGFKLYVKPFDIKFYLTTISLDIVDLEKDNKYADTYKIINNNIISVNSNNSKYVLNYKHRLNKNNDETNNEYHPHYLSLICEKYAKNHPQEHKLISIIT